MIFQATPGAISSIKPSLERLEDTLSRWVGRTDSGRPAPHIVESGRPRTGVWLSKEINNGKGLSMIWIFFLLKISDDRSCSFINVIVQ